MGVLVEWPSLTALPQTLRIVLWSCVIDWLIRTPYNWKPRLLLQKILRDQAWYAGSKRRMCSQIGDIFQAYDMHVWWDTAPGNYSIRPSQVLNSAQLGRVNCSVTSRESLVIFLFYVIAIDDSWGQYAQAMTHSGVEAFFKESGGFRGKHVQFVFQTRRCQELCGPVSKFYGLLVRARSCPTCLTSLDLQWSPLHIDSRSHVPWSWRAVPMSWSPPHGEWVDEDVFVWVFEMGQVARGRWIMLSFGDDKATRCWRKWICMDLFFPEYLNWAPPKAKIIFVLFPLRPIESGKC